MIPVYAECKANYRKCEHRIDLSDDPLTIKTFGGSSVTFNSLCHHPSQYQYYTWCEGCPIEFIEAGKTPYPKC